MLQKYTDIQSCIDRVVERCQITDFAQQELVESMLEDSAGSLGEKIVYRPYYVAARYLEQSIERQTLKTAPDNVEFTGLVTVITSLMAQQAALDSALALTIPLGMAAVVAGEKTQTYRRSYSAPSVVPLTTYF